MNFHMLKLHRVLMDIKPSSRVFNPNMYQSLCSESFYWREKLDYTTFYPNCGRLLPLKAGNWAKHDSVRLVSTATVVFKIRTKDDDPGQAKDNSKTDDSPKIILIDTEGKVSATTLMQAGKFAKQRDLKLVQIEDPAVKTSDRATYKLMSGRQYFELNRKNRMSSKSSSSSKGEKVLQISSTIASKDYNAKMVSIGKWLKKGFQIKATITSKGTPEDMKNIFMAIEKEVDKHQGRILQQREKFNDVKFYIAPRKEKSQHDKPDIKENVETEAEGHVREES